MTQDYQTKKTQTLVLIGLYTALVASVTLFTSVQYSGSGYFNLGDVIILILAAITPLRQALFAASLGSMIADLLAGAAHYAVFSGIIKGLMVVVVVMFRRFLKSKLYFIPFVLGSLLMLVGYGLVDAFILGGYTLYASMMANLVQAILGSVLAIALYPLSKKLM
ncbi:MAG TPA: ECF transporter S component, partial [Erysipelothrix sp.]|nr:ECF transporter S component [Erysipelothrix sp.]